MYFYFWDCKQASLFAQNQANLSCRSAYEAKISTKIQFICSRLWHVKGIVIFRYQKPSMFSLNMVTQGQSLKKNTLKCSKSIHPDFQGTDITWDQCPNLPAFLDVSSSTGRIKNPKYMSHLRDGDFLFFLSTQVAFCHLADNYLSRHAREKREAKVK